MRPSPLSNRAIGGRRCALRSRYRHFAPISTLTTRTRTLRSPTRAPATTCVGPYRRHVMSICPPSLVTPSHALLLC